MKLIEDGMDGTGREALSILSRRKWQIVLVFLLVVAGVTGGTLLMPKQYETSMKILVKNERADAVVTADSNSGSGFRGEVSETQINTEIELLSSKDLLLEVATKCDLERLEDSKSSPESEQQPVAVEKAVRRLQRDLKISPIRKANIIQVAYTAKDPELAVKVLRQLAESYLETHLRVHSTPGTYEFFTTQTERYGDQLEEQETQLADFRQRSSIVMLGQQKEIMLQRSAAAESALLQNESAIAEYTKKIADTRRQLETVSSRVTTQTRTVPNQYSVEHLGSLLAELKNRRTQLLAKFVPEDRMVQEVDQEIADTQEALKAAMSLTGTEQSTDVNPLHQTMAIGLARDQAELAGLSARQVTLTQQVQAYRQQLAKLDGVTPKYDDLVRRQKDAEDNYLLYKRKMEEARIAESLDQQKIANVAIAETPIEPHLPSKPNVPLNLALGVVLAAFVSLGTAFAAEFWQNPERLSLDTPNHTGAILSGQHLLPTVETSFDLEELTGLTVLATRQL